MTRTVVLVNPAAGRGRGARLFPRVSAAFNSVGVSDVRRTRAAGEEHRDVQDALQQGADTLVIVGGDGTWSKCAAAVAEARASVAMAFVDGGTGNDFAKNLPAPSRNPEAMARLVTGAHTVWNADMGRVEHEGGGDWFLNVAGFGFDVAVLEDIVRGGRLTGPSVYIVAALRQLLRYPGLTFSDAAPARRAMMLVLSNGMNFGGAFRIAPTAQITDGLLDAVEIGDIRGLARIPLFARALRGAHVRHPLVRSTRASEFAFTFDHAPSYEIDGEWRQSASREVQVRCVPQLLRVICSPAP